MTKMSRKSVESLLRSAVYEIEYSGLDMISPNFKRLLMQTTPGNIILSFQNVKDRDDHLP